MFISIDAFRFFDKAAQIFLHWMKNSLVNSHIFFLRLFCQTSFMLEFLFLTLYIYFGTKIQCYF